MIVCLKDYSLLLFLMGGLLLIGGGADNSGQMLCRLWNWDCCGCCWGWCRLWLKYPDWGWNSPDILWYWTGSLVGTFLFFLSETQWNIQNCTYNFRKILPKNCLSRSQLSTLFESAAVGCLPDQKSLVLCCSILLCDKL